MAEVELPNVEELEEMKGKVFTKRVALTTAIFAVILAIASLGGSNATKELLLTQQQVSDQWAFYQSKVLREHNYRNQRERLELDILERGNAMKTEVRVKYEALLKKTAEEESRYLKEKKEIEQEAKKLEHERNINKDKDPYFDYAEVLLQISIVMASISILAASRPVFYFAATAAALGTFLTINGYLLLIRIPFLH